MRPRQCKPTRGLQSDRPPANLFLTHLKAYCRHPAFCKANKEGLLTDCIELRSISSHFGGMVFHPPSTKKGLKKQAQLMAIHQSFKIERKVFKRDQIKMSTEFHCQWFKFIIHLICLTSFNFIFLLKDRYLSSSFKTKENKKSTWWLNKHTHRLEKNLNHRNYISSRNIYHLTPKTL